MADDVTQAATDSASAQAAQTSDSTSTTGSTTSDQAAQSPAEAELARIRKELADTRKEAAGYRVKLKEHDDAQLSETERLTARLADLEREQSTYQRDRQERTLRYEVQLAAARKGLVDPDAAYRLLDLAAIEFDDDGSPREVEKALDALVKARPYLAGQTGAPTSATSAANPSRGAGARGSDTFTQSQLNDYTFWDANRDAIMTAMREGRIVAD